MALLLFQKGCATETKASVVWCQIHCNTVDPMGNNVIC